MRTVFSPCVTKPLFSWVQICSPFCDAFGIWLSWEDSEVDMYRGKRIIVNMNLRLICTALNKTVHNRVAEWLRFTWAKAWQSVNACSHLMSFSATLSSVVTYSVCPLCADGQWLVPICIIQLLTVAVLHTHTNFSLAHRHRHTCTNLFSVQSGWIGKALLLGLTSQCICFLIASGGRSQGSCWADRWRAAVLTKLNGCSSRSWIDLQASGRSFPLLKKRGFDTWAFSALGKDKIQLKRAVLHKQKDLC